jgi:hypothetical protein
MTPETEEEIAAFRRIISANPQSNRDVDLDAYADGIVAHREGRGFHENPAGPNAATPLRLSWHLGWNDRALRQR